MLVTPDSFWVKAMDLHVSHEPTPLSSLPATLTDPLYSVSQAFQVWSTLRLLHLFPLQRMLSSDKACLACRHHCSSACPVCSCTRVPFSVCLLARLLSIFLLTCVSFLYWNRNCRSQGVPLSFVCCPMAHGLGVLSEQVLRWVSSVLSLVCLV